MDELRGLVRVATADVYKARVRTATLTRTPEGVRFTYLEGYDGPPVATTLPVSAPPRLSPAGAVPPFFAGLLPEGRRLSALRRAMKTSADDELSLLLAVGRDTIGDVQVVRAGEAPELPPPRVVIEDLGRLRFAELLRPEGIDRVGLPGIQEKVSARSIAVPLTTDVGAWILKLDPPEFPHLVRNEAFFLEAARRSGLEAASTRLVTDADGRDGLLVARFDRPVLPGGDLGMRAQEDGCQAADRYPADKYALTTEQVVGVLAESCRARPVAARDLVRQVAFAYVTGNGDQHAKNLSIVRIGGEWRVTPAYDVPSTHPYGDTTMALPIAGRDREDVTRRAFSSLGAAVGLPERAVARLLDELVASVPRWLDDLDTLPFDRRRLAKLRRLVLDRASKLSGS